MPNTKHPVDGDAERRAQLRQFLRSRRERLTPAQVGLPETPRRRTKGLRREEVAVLAGMGMSWYTWLEQGRDIKISERVVEAVSGALRLDNAERAHLYRLAGHAVPPPEPRSGHEVDTALLRILDRWMPLPAYVLDRYWNMIACNESARLVFGYAEPVPNCFVAFFTQADLRDRVSRWTESAANLVANFRSVATQYPNDPEFGRIVSRLRLASDEFDELWTRHDVRDAPRPTKDITHPAVGELRFALTAAQLVDYPEWRLSLLTPQPNTSTQQGLDQLLHAAARPSPQSVVQLPETG